MSKSFKYSKGFTLIELMVVITIIAILAVIGFSVFSGTQKNARDARRRSEIDTISKSIEASRDQSTNVYNYDATKYANDYNGAKPSDPSSITEYCITYSTTNTNTVDDPNPATWVNGCPTSVSIGGSDASATYLSNWLVFSTSAGYNSSLNIANVKGFKVCAKLETSGVFCKNNLIK